MKLAGVRVVDLSQFLPGPMLTLMMADHGAEVIKVEPPSGDPARCMVPFENGQSVWFRTTNRGKSSVVLDLKTDAGKAALWALLENADVMVESFRPGVMARLGFDYAAVSARNPRIVYCSLSAFGQTNPWADHPAHDIAAQALGGFLSVNDGPDGTPVVPGVPASDMAASLTGLSAVLMALFAREKSGRGDYVDISMQQSLMPWCGHIAGTAMTGGESPQSSTQRSLGGAAFYNIYETSDGRYIVLAGRELKFARTLLKALDREDLMPLATAEAGPAQQPLKDFLASIFITKSRDDWTAWFHDKDVAFAPVLNFSESFQHPAIQALAHDVKSNTQLAPAFTFASEADKILPDAPRLGENPVT